MKGLQPEVGARRAPRVLVLRIVCQFVLQQTMLPCNRMHCAVFYYTVLYCTALYCIGLHRLAKQSPLIWSSWIPVGKTMNGNEATGRVADSSHRHKSPCCQSAKAIQHCNTNTTSVYCNIKSVQYQCNTNTSAILMPVQFQFQ